MCEESACLVPPLDQARNGGSETQRTTSYNGELLVGFHEDAISQAAMGKAQLMLALVLGLALSADCIEIKIVNFILPAAELHLCIEEKKKGWLVAITLLAMACGSFTWGVLADYIGRKRALIFALTVATLFSAAAIVMPTYGTFMTARFGSGLGTAGAFPIVFSYLAETCSRSSRAKYVGLLHAMWPLGAAYTAIIFETTMPTLGEDIVRDNREHWSSWHRFLLLSILPTLGCIVGLMWTSESPRYLLEASREVEALAVYQRLHKLNQTRTQYGLTELELPGRNAYPERPSSPSRNMFAQSLDSIWQAFQKVSSPMYYRTTVLLAALHLICGFVHMGMSTFSMSMMKEVRENQYLAGKKLVENQRFSGHFNTTLENMYFKDCRFENATFTHMNLVHVNFWNCTIEDSQFFNVKASVFSIENSTVSNSKFVDTDLTDHHFINCVLINNTFLSLISNCVVDFDYNIYLDDLRIQNIIGPVVMTPVLFLIGVSLGSCFPSRSHMSVILWALICQTSLGILALTYDLAIFETITLSLQVQLNAVLNVITLLVLETYPCHIRCSAHGLMRSLFHVASLCAIPIYNSLTSTALIFPALTTATPCFLAAVLSLKLEDNSKVLM